MTPLGELRGALAEAAAELRDGHGAGGGVAPILERPKREGFGDYSTNAAMILAPVLGEPPRTIAEKLGEELRGRLGAVLDRFEVAGPGFLNLVLSDEWYRAALGHVLGAGERFGGDGAGPAAERILIEFVSANPTGPVTAASGRHAAYGDALARLLAFHGHAVEREYYINDYGTQVRKLGESIRARARGEEVPEDGYRGAYVAELAAEIPGADTPDADPDALAERGVALMVARIRATLERFRLEFDTWFSERSVHVPSAPGEATAVARAYAELEAHDALYRSEGALWLRTTRWGDDKDRVLERSSGEHTYFASDIAYHEHKRERGFDRLIDVWGADHHGYVARMRAAFAALGGDPERLEVLIMQMVNVIERGQRSSMSKRRGDFVTLDDLVADIGVDAARYYLLSRSHETTLDLDLDLARQESSENPVYYVQYAHARIASMLARAGEERVRGALDGVETGAHAAAVQLEPAERTLIKKLLAFPEEVAESVARRAVHRMAGYALELAQDFTAFYRDCRVVGAEPEEVESFRIALCVATRDTIARALGLLGVSAPESM